VSPWAPLGKLLLLTALIVAVVGLVFLFLDKLPGGWRLPGDIVYEGKRVRFYFPITTCLLISLIVSLLFWLFGRR